MLKRLVKLLNNYPMKVIFLTIIIVILLVFGVQSIFMATGNDTLVKTNTDVYKNNEMLEEEFGGESIIVLYESDDLLTPDHLKHMKGLENSLETNGSIYSMMSPITLVEEIARKQADTFQGGIVDIIDGLDEMGGKLTDISTELEENATSEPDMEFPELGDMKLPEMDDPELPDLSSNKIPDLERSTMPNFDKFKLPQLTMPNIGENMDGLDEAFLNLTKAQENLGEGANNLVGGYDQFGGQLDEIGEDLNMLAVQMGDFPQKEQLEMAGQKLIELGNQMSGISEETKQLPTIPEQTIQGLNNIQEKLNKTVQEQEKMLEEQKDMEQEMKKQQKKQENEIKQKMKEQQGVQEKEIKQEIENQQKEQEKEMKQKMQAQQEKQKEAIRVAMIAQQAEREAEMKELKDQMRANQEKQADMLSDLGKGLGEMGENLRDISENMGKIHEYSDIMSPGIPNKQATLENMTHDDEGLRDMFGEVIVDDNHMIMMIKFNAYTSDEEKTDVVDTINTYLNDEQMDSLETIVSGKPVLDNGIRSSMQESIQKMMGLALLLMVIVLFFVLKVRWRMLPLLIVLVAVIGTVGLMGWIQIPITMVSMAVFPILIGLGIDYAIQFQTRYTEEMTKEDSNE